MVSKAKAILSEGLPVEKYLKNLYQFNAPNPHLKEMGFVKSEVNYPERE
jgi:deoxyribodipyrimidine photo-lyase